MRKALGIDTSNYTTSTALYTEGEGFCQEKQLLPVKEGQLGLRQSDAVFHHVQQLPALIERLLGNPPPALGVIGVSVRPRDVERSYMPCFTVGAGMARSLAAVQGIPCHEFSHQAGHIAAALYSSGQMELLNRRFIAFHVSGGTTEAVLVCPDPEHVFHTSLIAQSLDLKGGQAIDRVGGMLGLTFPSGRELERLALRSSARYRIRPVMKGADCSLSGIQNQCEKLMREGCAKEDIALYCLQSVLAAVDGMAMALQKEYGKLPFLFAGGVMSNTIIRNAMQEKYGAHFAEPAFSADNAAGVAVLASVKEGWQ